MSDFETYKPGDILVYTGSGAEDAPKTFSVGTRLRIDRLHTDRDVGGYVVQPVDDDGTPFGVGEHVFDDEVGPDGWTPSPKKARRGKASRAVQEMPEGLDDALDAMRAESVTRDSGDILTDPDSPAAIEAQRALEPFAAPSGALTLTTGVKAALADAKDALDAAKTLSKQIESNYFTLGGILAYIYESQAFHLVPNTDYSGKRGWQDYIKNELSGLDYRKTMYWISIYRAFSAVGIDETRVPKLGGWSKAKEIARLYKARDVDGKPIGERLLLDNFEKLAEVAAEQTREELKDYVDAELFAARGQAGKDNKADPVVVIAKKTVKFRLPEARVEAVNRLLAVAREAFHVNDDSEALETIITEWAESRSVEVPLADAVRALEARYGVHVRVEQPEAAESTR
jgi:hypothetical protein